jgi:hypothetical protein
MMLYIIAGGQKVPLREDAKSPYSEPEWAILRLID